VFLRVRLRAKHKSIIVPNSIKFCYIASNLMSSKLLQVQVTSKEIRTSIDNRDSKVNKNNAHIKMSQPVLNARIKNPLTATATLI